jgi:hypothetical protein
MVRTLSSGTTPKPASAAIIVSIDIYVHIHIKPLPTQARAVMFLSCRLRPHSASRLPNARAFASAAPPGA